MTADMKMITITTIPQEWQSMCVQGTAVNIRFLLAIFKVGGGSGLQCEPVHCLAEKRNVYCCNWKGVKNGVRTCVTHQCEFINTPLNVHPLVGTS